MTGAVGLQETGNIDYVSKNRYGLFALDSISLIKALDSLGSGQRDAETNWQQDRVEDGATRIAGVILEKMQWARDLPA